MNNRMTEDKIINIDIKYQFMEAIDMFGEEVPNIVTSSAEKHLLEKN